MAQLSRIPAAHVHAALCPAAPALARKMKDTRFYIRPHLHIAGISSTSSGLIDRFEAISGPPSIRSSKIVVHGLGVILQIH